MQKICINGYPFLLFSTFFIIWNPFLYERIDNFNFGSFTNCNANPLTSNQITCCLCKISHACWLMLLGAQWLSGRVLDSRQRGRGSELHRRHCVVSLSKNINLCLGLVQPRKTRPFITERLLMVRKEPNQTNKQTNKQTNNKQIWARYLNSVLNFCWAVYMLK